MVCRWICKFVRDLSLLTKGGFRGIFGVNATVAPAFMCITITKENKMNHIISLLKNGCIALAMLFGVLGAFTMAQAHEQVPYHHNFAPGGNICDAIAFIHAHAGVEQSGGVGKELLDLSEDYWDQSIEYSRDYNNQGPNFAAANGNTPIICAAKHGVPNLVQSIINYGASPNTSDKKGVTALMWAAKNGDMQIFNLLMGAGADVDATHNNGRTAIYFAANNGHLEIVNALIEADADVNAARDDGSTPLSVAEAKGYTEIVVAISVANTPDTATYAFLTDFGQDMPNSGFLLSAYLDHCEANDGECSPNIYANDQPLIFWAISEANRAFVDALITDGLVCPILDSGETLSEVAQNFGKSHNSQVLYGIAEVLHAHDEETCGDRCPLGYDYSEGQNACFITGDPDECEEGGFAWWDKQGYCFDPAVDCANP